MSLPPAIPSVEADEEEARLAASRDLGEVSRGQYFWEREKSLLHEDPEKVEGEFMRGVACSAPVS